MRQQAIMSSENELQARDAGAADAPTERSSSSTADRGYESMWMRTGHGF